MKSADILATLEGVKLTNTISGSMEYILPAIAMIVFLALSCIMIDNFKKSGETFTFCKAAAIVFLVISLAAAGLTIHDAMSDKSATKYVVEIAEDLPESSKMILTQNFRTIEVKGNTYTMVKR